MARVSIDRKSLLLSGLQDIPIIYDVSGLRGFHLLTGSSFRQNQRELRLRFASILKSVALRIDWKYITVVSEAIQQCRGHNGITEKFSPF